MNIFLRDPAGHRPVFGDVRLFQTDPHWRDHILFYEYFHGDNGSGFGASHQTGWTALVAELIGPGRRVGPVPRECEISRENGSTSESMNRFLTPLQD